MPLRQTLQWMFVLLATIVIVGGGGLIWLWGQSGAILRSEIDKGLKKLAPDLPVSYKTASLESDGRVRLSDIRLMTADLRSPLLQLAEVVIYPDREIFVEHRQFSPQKVMLTRPQIVLEQTEAGGWNFEGLQFPKPAGMAWPEVELLDGEILMRAHRESLLPIELRLTNLDAHLKPTARGQCEIRGHGDLDPIGPVDIVGALDTTTGRWNVEVQARRVPAGDQLIGLASDLSPMVKTKVQAVTQAIREKTRPPGTQVATNPQAAASDTGIQTVGVEAPVPVHTDVPTLIPGIGLRADLAVLCQVSCEGFEQPIDYSVDLRIENGELTNLFPIPLYEVSGHIQIDRDRIQIETLKASNGESQLAIQGEIPRGTDPGPPAIQIRASNLPVDERIKCISPKMALLYDQLQPKGHFDIDLAYAPERKPPVILREFRVHDGSMQHFLFQYPVNSIEGTIVQEGDKFLLNMTGLGSGHEGVLTGVVQLANGDFDADLRIQTPQGLPVDNVLIAAFDTPKLKAIAATLRALQIRGGYGDVDVSFRKVASKGPKFQTFLKADLKNCEINYDRFPMKLSDVSGHIEHDPTQGNVWHFQNLQGTRGEALVTGNGQYEIRDGVGKLDLELNATDVPIDASLKTACISATSRLQEVWTQLNPSAGKLDVQKVNIQWSPGQVPLIALPMVKVEGAAMKLAALPYPLDRVSGSLSWDGQTALVEYAEGWHGSTYVELNGTAGKPSPFFQIQPAAGVDWRLHLPEIAITRLIADEELHKVLPESIRTAVKQIDPRGPFDMVLALDMKQYRAPEPTVTASFKLDTTLKDNRLNAGVTLERATGHVSLINGTWDGQLLAAEGYVDLDSAQVWDLPLSQLEGPFSIVGNRITAGKPPVGSPQPYSEKNPFAEREVVANLYDGKVSLNAEAVVDHENSLNTKYDAEVNLRNAKLELWAKEKGSRERLRGPVNGRIAFHGVGPSPLGVEGVGYVDITQAQLYELPVLIKVFSMTNFRSQDDKAFKYAYADFQIRQGQFDFTGIQLVGDAISLVGRGKVGFAGEQDGRISFDFYTDARNRVPVLEPIIQRVASRWVWVRVDGTIDNYKAVIQPRVPILDDAIKGLMNGIESGQPRVPSSIPTARLPAASRQ